jgi:cytochrome c oxidase assembly protein subunit 11
MMKTKAGKTSSKSNLQQKNARLGMIVLVAVVCMVGLAFASVPLYSLFCRVTGFGGTTQAADSFPETITNRIVTIKFDGSTAQDLPWDFAPQQRQVKLRVGDKGIAAYTAYNKAPMPVAGTALYNVTPAKAGKYFHKVQCFCFDEQVLEPGQRANMPVLFYVDPEMVNDPQMDDVTTITLSYSFFKTDGEALERALEAFYNGETNDIKTTQ